MYSALAVGSDTTLPDNTIREQFPQEKTSHSGDKRKNIGKFVCIAKPRHVDSKTINRLLSISFYSFIVLFCLLTYITLAHRQHYKRTVPSREDTNRIMFLCGLI
jgi:hypothetical protein